MGAFRLNSSKLQGGDTLLGFFALVFKNTGDSITAVDTEAVLNPIVLSDSVSANANNGTISQAITDSITATEQQSITVVLSDSDTGTTAVTNIVPSNITASDLGQAVEAAANIQTIQVDIASTIAAASINTGSLILIFSPDIGGAVEQVNLLSVQIVSSDSGGGTEGVPANNIQRQDSSTVTEIASAVVPTILSLLDIDQGTIAEFFLLVSTAITSTDSFQSVENIPEISQTKLDQILSLAGTETDDIMDLGFEEYTLRFHETTEEIIAQRHEDEVEYTVGFRVIP